ncbi:PKD domain-containing protein [Nakamurella silvestris]|nr:PKD domain-containing protein [Nakamurella silvestris]
MSAHTKSPRTAGRLGRLGIAAVLAGSGLVVLPQVAVAAEAHPPGVPQICDAPLGAVTVNVQLTVPAGKHCDLTGTTLHGDVVVEANGWLSGTGVTLGHKLTATNPLGISLTDSTIAESVTVTADSANWETGFLYLTDTKVTGALSVTGEVDVEFTDSEFTGAVSTTDTNYTDVFSSSFGSTFAVTDNTYGSYLCDLSAAGNVTLDGNGYQLAAFADVEGASCEESSTVGGNLTVKNNTGDTTLGTVKVTGDITLADNNPEAVAKAGVSLCGALTGRIGGAAIKKTFCDDGASALDWDNYEKVLLTKDIGEPIDLAVLPDGKVLHTARNGVIRITDPSTGVTKTTNTIPVYANSEDGLQTIGVDPDFADNKWVYVYYAPPGTTPAGTAPNTLPAGADPATYWKQWEGVNRLSRFKWTGTALDLATEQTIIEVPVQRGQCCHVAGDFDWDDDGNLYLATGDNTPASAPGANGFAPNNDAPNMNPGFDARRGAGNTNDLRGKILRITVAADGSYTVPAGNLFAPGTEKTRPEIFVMGVRNPFRIDVDGPTNSLSWGDYGPDSGVASAERGPMGLVEWNTVALNKPSNSGWPYCTGDNFAYNEWNFETSTPRGFFNCTALKNNSRWNTGLVDLPPAIPATLWYGDNPGDQPWDELVDFGVGGQGPHGGPVYHYDPANPSPTKFPAYWDNKAFFGEFAQDYLAVFTVDWDTSVVDKIEHFLPNDALETNGQPVTDNPMDLEFGPDGSLYVLEYGDGFFRQNPDSGLYKISYVEGNKSPKASFTATPISSSAAPLTVNFNAAGSVDPEGETLTYQWDFDGDGTFDATGVTASHTYTTIGQFTARLKVTDPQGGTGLISKVISVGNVAPVVTINTPADGSFFEWGKAIPYRITTADAEDGTATVCTRVAWTFGLGHAEHAHPESIGTGCTGAWPTPIDAPEHGATEKIYGAVVVTYTDNGHNGVAPAAGEAAIILNPKLQQAEHATVLQGVEVADVEGASGSRVITGLASGDYLKYAPVNFAGITGVSAVAKGIGDLQLRWGSATAAPFATIAINNREGWQTVEKSFTAPTGTGELFVTSAAGLDVDAFTFLGNGVDDVTKPVISHTLNPAAPTGVGGVYNKAVALTIAATDNGTLSSVQYSVDNGGTWTTLRATNGLYPAVNFTTNGARTVLYRATDNGGNVANGTVSFTIDLAAANSPAFTATTSPAAPNGTNDWYKSAVTVTLVPVAGITGTAEYRLAGGAWLPYTSPVVVAAQGSHLFEYRSTVAGVTSAPTSLAFKIDSIAPVTAPELGETSPYTVTLASADALSGILSTEYRIGSGAWTAYGTPFTVTAGAAAQTISFRSTDNAGNVEATRSLVVPAAPVVRTATTTSLTLPVGPVLLTGKSSAKVVVSGNGGTPSGQVVIYSGDTLVGAAPLVNGQATVALVALTAGTVQLRAGYVGDATFAPSDSAAGSLVVTFGDVKPNHQFFTEILWAAGNGITTGHDDGTFQPAASITRQAAAAMLYRFAHPGAPAPTCTVAPFTDVPVTGDFCGEISWLKSAGITTGHDDGTFKPGATITREAIAAFIYRVANNGGKAPACTSAVFPDVSKAHPFCGEIKWLVEKNIVRGFDDGTFKPGANVARDATAAFLYRLAGSLT